MLRIAVCDDEKIILQQMEDMIRKFLPECNISKYLSGNDLLEYCLKFDIIFLDIQMENMNGIETARKIRRYGEDTIIIFITGVKKYVFEAFDVSAFHYLLILISNKTNTFDSQDTNAGIEQLVNTESESIGSSVVFNAEKRARQIASAKTAAEIRMVLGLLNKDLSDCKSGVTNGMCDEAEVAKVEAILRRAQQKMSEVGSNSEAESDGSFFINMLM